MRDEELLKIVDEWFNKNHNLFKLEQYYGVDIVIEIFNLLKQIDDLENKQK